MLTMRKLNKMPTQEYLKSIFHYNPVTGEFTRLSTGNRLSCRNVEITAKDHGIKMYSMRVLIWIIHYGITPNENIRLRDGDSENTKINNLYTVKEVDKRCKNPEIFGMTLKEKCSYWSKRARMKKKLGYHPNHGAARPL